MKTTPVSRVIAFCLFVPLAASAQAPDRGARPERPTFDDIWQRYDVNGDGFLSPEEFAAMRRIARLDEEQRQRIFNRLDKNGDGRISRDELREMRQRRDGGGGRQQDRRGMRRLMELDTDGSGGVSLEEFKAAEMFANIPAERVEALFGRLDTDGDGEITPRDRPALPPMLRGGGDAPERPEAHRRMFARLDADNSGTLTFEEFRKAPGIQARDEDAQEALFLRLDADGDKRLNHEEFAKLPMAEWMPPRGNRRQGRAER